MHEPRYHRRTDYNRALLPNHYLAQLEVGVRSRDEWVEQTGHSLGHPGWGLLYYTVLCRLAPEGRHLIIETGTNLAASTIVLAQALVDSGATGVVRTVEIDKVNYLQAVENVRRAGLADWVEVIQGNSLDALPAMLDAEVQVAFLDGNHVHDHVLAEFELVRPRLATGGIVVFDNTFPIAEESDEPRVHEALHTILDRHGGNLVNLPYCSYYTPGMALWQADPLKANAL